jgi:hypothetical protein
MAAFVALLVVVLSQVGFWALLRAGVFLGALCANVVFWCAAFPASTVAERRWWRMSAAPDVSLALLLIAMTVGSFWLVEQTASEASRNAWGWVGFFGVPLALIATVFATLRVRAVRRVADFTGAVASGANVGPRPGTVAIIAAVFLLIALLVFALLIAVNIGGPR